MILEVFYAWGKYCSSKCPCPAELVELKNYFFQVYKNFSKPESSKSKFLWLILEKIENFRLSILTLKIAIIQKLAVRFLKYFFQASRVTN